jgi:hypothetical protein
MTDREFDVLEELYFTVPFERLKKNLEWSNQEILDVLMDLLTKGWVKGFDIQTDSEIEDVEYIRKHYTELNFLATKKGLMAHNSKG